MDMNYFIAHRGVHHKNCKENSLDAFKMALDSDLWDGFECDVRTSLDGVFVICHNSFIGTRIISKTNYSILKRKYKLTSLTEVLKLKSNKLFLLEIKESNINLDRFIGLINKYKDKKIYVMSFNKKVIHELKRKGFLGKTGVLSYVLNSEESYDDYDFICILENIVSNRLISYFQKRDIDVFLYGINHLKKSNLKYDNIYFICDKKVL